MIEKGSIIYYIRPMSSESPYRLRKIGDWCIRIDKTIVSSGIKQHRKYGFYRQGRSGRTGEISDKK